MIAGDGGIIPVHGLLEAGDGVAVILLIKGLALKHEVRRFGQGDHIEAVGDRTVVVGGNFHTLYICGSAWLFIGLRQPQAHRLAAQRVHAQQYAPHVAAYLFAVGKVILCVDAPFDDDLVRRLADDLYENIFGVAHCGSFLSQSSEFRAVSNKKRDGNGISGIFTGRHTEFPDKGADIAVHAAEAQRKRCVGDGAVLIFQPQC